ncbi:SurA N-terminal domain-containing protein [Kordiimonas sp. SCSIO 12610]|uniref:SurA N-terminal domain-containing protein n=1 Tax=Kordiimonas sp. SCSIO 12610 TaxID=2829597 RepID=UPI00210986D0|nr:SurA N-terminal domain-containing protein [Kordiimonas sp. SCSIO 12610]UTW54034.1 SurA N-terminal domain-containing protein [Kordiimonas sp. SCSIO 12610]
MLLKFRGGLNSLPVTILLGLLIAAFAIFGVGPGILTGSNTVIATVGETDIPNVRYFSRVQQEAQQAQLQLQGANLPQDEIIRLLNIDQRVLQQMIAEATVEEHMRELGLRATDEQIVEAIRDVDAFKLAGSLSASNIELALQNNNLNRDDLEELLSKGVTQQQLFGAMRETKPISRVLANELYTYQAERRWATLITFKASDITEITPATDEQLMESYEATKTNYMTNELRTYNYLVVTPDLFLDQVEVTEDDILALYDERADEYVIPEKRTVQQVNFPSEEAAQAFIDSLTAETDFAARGAASSDFTEAEINLGEQSLRNLEVDFNDATAQAVFGLENDGITIPLEALGRWNVFKVTNITEGNTTPLESVREALETDAKREKAIDLVYDFMPDLEDALASAATIQEAINTPLIKERNLPLTVASVTGVDQRGLGRGGERLITQSDEFRINATIFNEEADIGRISDTNDLDASNRDRGAFWTEVVTVAEPEQKPFEEVKADVRSAWDAQQKQTKAGELADNAIERIKAGEDAETVAADLNGTSLEAKSVSRTNDPNSLSGLAANIRGMIFDLNLNAVETDRSADGDGYVVVRVDRINPGQPADNATAVNTLYSEIQDQFETEIFLQYERYLREKYTIDVNDQLRRIQFRNESAQ